jgi:hypothetical protein
VRLVIAVPHRGGISVIEQNPGIHRRDVTIAEKLIIRLPMPCRVKKFVNEWSFPVQEAAYQSISPPREPIDLRV